ncbi:F-box/LRR-repeat protein At1g06630-like [Mercurialis annua]|uniref:F-box/LRR-repeat protein At1g06630-like n=1 Tax=Mercurialis annua TaxID=3986 RepID=UPI00215FAB9A|nr:F-box/LRR-repeat protein At1g06630-like [Mercurialis annua]
MNLSNLPDAVLVHIISRLETKEAIRTSVLSKRWECLWASKYDFTFEEGCNNRRSFRSIVDRAFAIGESSSINEFRLSCKVGRDDSDIKTWICAAVKRRVQVVSIKLDGVLVLPPCLLTCATLTSLCLNLSDTSSLPTSICLPALKLLELDSVLFLADNSLHNLLSGCPVLEELIFSECCWLKLTSFSISATMLQHLEIIEEIWFRSNSSSSDGSQVVKFGTCNFKSFNHCGDVGNEYCIYNSHSTAIAHMYVSYSDGNRKKAARRAYKLMNRLANAEKLILKGDIFEVLSDAEELLPNFPSFQRLAHLQFKTPSVNLDCKPLLMWLHCSRYLKTLVFDEGISLLSDFSENDDLMNPMPRCLLNEVKNIKVNNFSGKKKELQAVEFLLKNALVLENMSIICIVNSWRLLRKVTEQLRGFPKGSESCNLLIAF